MKKRVSWLVVMSTLVFGLSACAVVEGISGLMSPLAAPTPAQSTPSPRPTLFEPAPPLPGPPPKADSWEDLGSPDCPSSGSANGDYREAVNFFDPFSVFDILHITNPQDFGYPKPVAGTADVGLLTVTPNSFTGAGPMAGVVAYCYATGQALWSQNYPEYGNHYFSDLITLSNGVDRVAVAVALGGMHDSSGTTLWTLDARTGAIVSSATYDDYAVPFAMAAQTIVIHTITQGPLNYLVRGYQVDDLSVQVWQHYSTTGTKTSTIGQWVLVSGGYIEITDGSRAGFGSDFGGEYKQIGGVLFRKTNCDSVHDCYQQYDVATRSVVGNSPMVVDRSASIVVAEGMLVADCGSLQGYEICGYRLSDGREVWKVSVRSRPNVRGPIGQYVLITDRDSFLVQVSNGQNQLPSPSEYLFNLEWGPTILYKWDDSTITAYDGSGTLQELWTVPKPDTESPSPVTGVMISSGHLIHIGSDGQVWVAHPQ